MARVRVIQTSFTAGELDPRLAAQNRFKAYFSGAERMRNVLVIPQGGFRRRPGLEFVADLTALAAASGARLVPFSFNTEQNYMMVFLAGRMLVFKDDAQVADVTGAWTAAQAAQMNWAQSADTLILVHPELAPQKIVRAGSHSAWTVSALALTNIPQFDFGAGPEAVISAARGWPVSVTFHQGRLWFGGLKSRPATLLASKLGDFFNFDTALTTDEYAINVTIDSDQVNAILNLAAGRHLQVFTSGGEFTVQVSGPITPKNIAIAEQTRRGSKAGARPAEVDGASIFVQRGGKALRQFLFSDAEQAYQSSTISLLAPHLIVDPVEVVARKSSRLDDADYVVLVNADGTAAVLNTLRSEEVNAFTLCSTDGAHERTAVMDGAVYWIVKRTIGGVPVRYLEKWNDAGLLDAAKRYTRPAATSATATGGQTVFPWSSGAVTVSAVKVRKNGQTLDQGTHYTVSGLPGTSGNVTLTSGAAAGDAVAVSYPLAQATGLAHLDGRSVRAVVDGALQQAKTVASGAVALDPPAETEAEAGLEFAILVRTMPVEAPLPDGTMVGRQARVVKVTGRLHDAKGLRINGQSVAFRRLGPVGVGPLDQPVNPLSGDFEAVGIQGWAGRAQVEIAQDGPLPLTVLGLAMHVGV